MPFCSNCGREISGQAVMCPQCGHPGPAHHQSPLATFGGPVARANYASYGARVGAYLIDGLIIFGVLMLFFLLAVAGHNFSAIMFVIFFSLAGVVYKPIMEGARGQTLGKMAVHIKVVRAADAGPIGYGEAFLRWLVGAVIGIVPFGSLIDLLWPLWDEHVQTLHDKAAKTIVVQI